MQVRPICAALGAELLDFDMNSEIGPDAAAALRRALAEHHLLVVRGHTVTSADQRRFASVFGDIVIRADYDKAPDEEADTQHVSNRRADGILGDGELDFHCDQLFQTPPLKALALYAIEVPAQGGDTKFSNTARAFARMPEALKARMAKLSCMHLYDFKADFTKPQDPETATPGSPYAVHPMLWTDPDSGARGVWVNKNTTIRVMEMDGPDGRALIEEIRSYFYDEDVIYTHQWRADDLVIWNNRVLQHARTYFDPRLPRTLRRTPLL